MRRYMAKKESQEDLLKKLDILNEWAERSVPQACLWGIQQSIKRAYGTLKDYIQNSEYRKHDRRNC